LTFDVSERRSRSFTLCHCLLTLDNIRWFTSRDQAAISSRRLPARRRQTETSGQAATSSFDGVYEEQQIGLHGKAALG
jgi:hypothetical protein